MNAEWTATRARSIDAAGASLRSGLAPAPFARYAADVASAIGRMDHRQVENALGVLERAWREGRTIFTLGNGGSHATASHAICDWNKGVSYGRPAEQRMRALCIGDNPYTLTAYANDVDYRDAFAEQLQNFVRPGDVVLAISGSGNSENVLRAVKVANEAGAITLALTGFDGGKLRRLAQHNVHVPSNDMQVVEDAHIMFVHHALKELSARADAGKVFVPRGSADGFDLFRTPRGSLA